MEFKLDIKLLLVLFVCVNTLHAKTHKDAIDKLETTAKKIKTAKIFYSDSEIKSKIKISMKKDQKKWQQARIDYLNVVKKLKELQIDVEVPETLDELLIERVDKDADKILMMLANKVKKHLSA
tara:strand:+ start:164 stop:532 length:369 start_codon:yes stop_codon:yes gene_type:complete